MGKHHLPPCVVEGVQVDEDGLKRCSKCKQRKDPTKDFGKHPKAKDGLQTACKACYADYQTERRKDPAKKTADRARINLAMSKRAQHYLTLHNAARQRRRQDPVYRAQELADQRTWRAQKGRAAQQYHERRARKLAALVNGPLPPGTYAQVLASGPCVYCGRPATSVDHVVALARGGHEVETNLVPACASCNGSKGAKLLTEWDPVRVAHAAECSEKVAAVLAA
jgi:5-methylcytosine-specific restriction endonuclease McrA